MSLLLSSYVKLICTQCIWNLGQWYYHDHFQSFKWIWWNVGMMDFALCGGLARNHELDLLPLVSCNSYITCCTRLKGFNLAMSMVTLRMIG